VLKITRGYRATSSLVCIW